MDLSFKNIKGYKKAGPNETVIPMWDVEEKPDLDEPVLRGNYGEGTRLPVEQS